MCAWCRASPSDGSGQVDAPVVDAQALRRVEVVPDDHLLGATDERRAHLGRAQPVEVDVGDGVATERHREVADARVPGADRIRAERGDPRWAACRPGRMKSRIDRSCGPRSHSTSMSGWTRPRFTRTESTYWISPSSPDVDQLADLQDRRRVAVGVVAHQHEATLLGHGDELAARRPARRPAASRPARADRTRARRAPPRCGCPPASRPRPPPRRDRRARRRGRR